MIALRRSPETEPDNFAINRIVVHGNDSDSAYDRLIASSPGADASRAECAPDEAKF